MNDLQKKEFELLKLFVDVCKKLNLQYYLVCGTALGAVKYQGFIPWDDDIDVGLPRNDYERFLKEAGELLPSWVFIQNYRTDEKYPQLHTKLRNSNTTYIEKGVSNIDMNHGVYIDIFPLDGYPIPPGKKRIFELKKKIFTWKYFCALDNDENAKVRVRNTFFRVLGYHKRTAKTLLEYDKYLSKYTLEGSMLMCNHANWQGKLEYAPKEYYGKGTLAVFEGLDIIVPEEYDAYLTQKYGNWREDPPIEKQVGHHYYLICDVNKSYVNYMREDKC